MDPAWLLQLDEQTRNLLVGAAGNLVGNLATQAVNGLLSAGTRQLQRRYAAEPEREALDAAMAQALADTLAWLTDDPDEISHLTTLFESWLAREAVTDELYQLLEPNTDTTWDLELLTNEFAAAGWSPESLDLERSFAEIVAKLVDAFTNAAAKQPLLQPLLQLHLLQTANSRLQQLVQQQDTQIALQQQMVALLQRFAPLDLTEAEQPYLRQLYWQCNDLPLIRERRGLERYSKARLQRVYVDLELKHPSSLELILDRLGIKGKRRRTKAKENIIASLKTIIPYPASEENAEHTHQTSVAPWRELASVLAAAAIENETSDALNAINISLRAIPEDQRASLLQALQVSDEQFQAALGNLTPLEALREHKQIVILGDPGSGKSTYIQRLAALFAAISCHDRDLRADLEQSEVDAIECVLTTFGRPLLPVRIVLNQWAKHLVPQRSGCADDLVKECVRLLAQAGDYGLDQKKHFAQRLQGDAPTALLLLDGLDEVSDAGPRAVILKAVAAFQVSYPQVPMIVTCRIRPYAALQAAIDRPAFALASLTLSQMERFLERWYAELVRATVYESATKAAEKQQALVNALQGGSRRALTEMAQTPLLLTSMAHINYSHGLPDSRAKLYEYLVHQLLYEWERHKQGDGDDQLQFDALLSEVKLEINQFSLVLNRVAYELHSQHRSPDTVDIAHATLRAAFAPLYGDGPARKRDGWVAALLELIANRSGLIYATDTTPGTETYRFSHRTFQEYLAARHLAIGDTETKVKNFERHIDDEHWYESLLLGIGYMAEAQPPQIDDIILLLLRLLPPTLATPLAPQRLLLLGEAYVHILRPERAQQAADRERAGRVEQQLIGQLTAAMQHPTLPPHQRLDAGLLLAELEDGPADVDALVTINGARTLGYQFKIGKYPVTNAQYRRFVADGGYCDEQWWSKEGRQAKAQYGYTELRWWDNRFNRSSQPVVGISWYEAEAYCKWLTAQWRAAGTIEPADQVRLPTRLEWEAAVRNKHGKEYPWASDEFDPTHANTEESGLGQTSPVHMYPNGVSADGVWDLAGNVFEWTSDLVEGGPERAWLKGGSCDWDNSYAKASAAVGGLDRWNGYSLFCGLRVVIVLMSR